MNDGIDGVWIIVIILALLGVASILGVVHFEKQEKKDVDSFCLEKGFDTSIYFLFEKKNVWCEKIENNTIIRKQIIKREDKWYFLEEEK